MNKLYRKKGIGKKALKYLLKEAISRGYKKIVLSTEVNWFAAIYLYENWGFKEYDRNDVDVHMYKNL